MPDIPLGTKLEYPHDMPLGDEWVKWDTACLSNKCEVCDENRMEAVQWLHSQGIVVHLSVSYLNNTLTKSTFKHWKQLWNTSLPSAVISATTPPPQAMSPYAQAKQANKKSGLANKLAGSYKPKWANMQPNEDKMTFKEVTIQPRPVRIRRDIYVRPLP